MNIETGDQTLDEVLARLRSDRAELEERISRMDYRTRVTVMTLRERGIVVRRVAAMCGISPARVSQIEKQERS